MLCWGFGVAKTFIFWREGQKLFFLSIIKTFFRAGCAGVLESPG